MDNSKQNLIREIAQELDCGNNCFYNPRTSEIVAIPNFLYTSDEDEFKEPFGADLKKVGQQKTDFIKFEVLEGFESFKIMERFVEQISDQKLRTELENILAKKKSFQNFKYSINHSNFRQNWFDFKQSELKKIVENQLNSRKAST